MLKPLPVGIQTFRKLVEQGYLYVDKTRAIHRLLTEGEGYFLSRLRRFGKGLLLSMLEAIFRGRRELFAGRWIAGSDYGWEEHPVVRVDCSQFRVQTAGELVEALQPTWFGGEWCRTTAREGGVGGGVGGPEASPGPAVGYRAAAVQPGGELCKSVVRPSSG